MSEPEHWRYRRLADMALNLSMDAHEQGLYCAYDKPMEALRWLGVAMAHRWVLQLAQREILLNLNKT